MQTCNIFVDSPAFNAATISVSIRFVCVAYLKKCLSWKILTFLSLKKMHSLIAGIFQDKHFLNDNLARYTFSKRILKELNFQIKSIHGIKGSDL